MTYTISRAKTLFLLTTIGTTGCLDFLADPIVGDWNMVSLDDNCINSGDTEVCFNIEEFTFSVSENDGFSVDTFDVNGDFVFLFSDGTDNTYNFRSEDMMKLVATGSDATSYTISTSVLLDTDSEEIVIGFDLDCSLTEEETLDCTLFDVTIDDEEDDSGYVSTFHIVFKK
jgi:hypothetical protein